MMEAKRMGIDPITFKKMKPSDVKMLMAIEESLLERKQGEAEIRNALTEIVK